MIRDAEKYKAEDEQHEQRVQVAINLQISQIFYLFCALLWISLCLGQESAGKLCLQHEEYSQRPEVCW